MMTVTDVLLTFRKAMLAVVPHVEAVGIPWRRPDAYDEWDAIADALYNALVVNVLRWSLPETKQDDFELPRYDLLLATYAGKSVVEALHPSLGEGRWIFHALGTVSSPFDIVEVRQIDWTGNPVREDLVQCSLAEAEFRLRLHGETSTIEEVSIRG